MKIHYKLIEHERTQDAPFVGALISATRCNYNCKNCFNQEVKKYKTQVKEAEEIIAEIKANPFNEGIIFGGLEWGLQTAEMKELAYLAKKAGLLVMVYTGAERVTPIYQNGCFDYVKYGRYDETLKSDDHYECGVKLASTNQHILDMRHWNEMAGIYQYGRE